MDFSRKAPNIQREVIITVPEGRLQQVQTVKYLGVLLDTNLNFKKHATAVKEKVRKDIAALKYLKGTNWGNHPNEQIILYKMAIRPKIEYGSSATIWTKTHFTNTLQKQQNQALRQILGAVRTSPINSLHAVSGIPPLTYRLTTYALRQLLLLCVTSNRVREIVMHLHYTLANSRSSVHGRLKRDIAYLVTIIRDHQVFLPTELQLSCTVQLRNLSQRCQPNIPGVTKQGNISHEEMKQRTLHHLSTKYPNFDQIYTDGAKNHRGSGSAMFCVPHNLGWGKRLTPITSSFHAEVMGIEMAVQHAETHCPGQNIVILSDSKSTITAIGNLNLNQPPPIHLIRILQSLHHLAQSGVNVYLQWIPSHSGIRQNENCDRLAVLSCDNGLIQPQTVTYHTDCYDNINMTQTAKWTDTYNSATGAGGWTRSITNAPMKDPWFSNMIDTERRHITSVNRLLLGHGFNNLYKYTMRHRTTPNCDLCNIGEVQSLQHLLIHCSFTRTTMTSFIHQNDTPMEAAVVQYLRQGLQEPDRLLDLQRALHQIGIPI